MDIPVQRIIQHGKVLYIGAMPVRDILSDHFLVDSWDPGKLDLVDQGYQRKVDEIHVRKIETWLRTDPVPFMPTGALLSAREADYGQLPFREIAQSNGATFGVVTVPTGRTMFIVDYQHRWNGLRRAV